MRIPVPWPQWTVLHAAAVVAAGTAAGVRAAAPDGTPHSTQAHASAPPLQVWHTTATGAGSLLTPGQMLERTAPGSSHVHYIISAVTDAKLKAEFLNRGEKALAVAKNGMIFFFFIPTQP